MRTARLPFQFKVYDAAADIAAAITFCSMTDVVGK